MSKYTYTVENLERAINNIMTSMASVIAKTETVQSRDLAEIFLTILNVWLAKEGMKDKGDKELPQHVADALDEALDECKVPSFVKLCRGEL